MGAKKRKLTKREEFELNFAPELDIFDSALAIPDWVFANREQNLGKTPPKFMALARFLKNLGLRFKIYWPIEIDGRWKFADFWFPGQRTVIIVRNYAQNFRPCGLPSERAEFFQERYRVVEVEDVSDLRRIMERKPGASDVC